MKKWTGGFGGAALAVPVLALVMLGAARLEPNKKPQDVGFTEEQAKGIGLLHQVVVESLDDLSPTTTRRMLRETKDGTVVIEVEPSFGASRIPPISISHGKLTRELPYAGSEGPYLYSLISANGAPMKRDNLKVNVTRWGFPAEVRMEDETLLEVGRDALRDALKGKDYGVKLANRLPWLKPLKLTHAECLGCHGGMKVGDTVGIAAYVAKKPQ